MSFQFGDKVLLFNTNRKVWEPKTFFSRTEDQVFIQEPIDDVKPYLKKSVRKHPISDVLNQLDPMKHRNDEIRDKSRIVRLLQVYWKDDDQFYPSTVRAFDGTIGKIHMEYDNGDFEDLHFKNEEWKNLPTENSYSNIRTSLSAQEYVAVPGSSNTIVENAERVVAKHLEESDALGARNCQSVFAY